MVFTQRVFSLLICRQLVGNILAYLSAWLVVLLALQLFLPVKPQNFAQASIMVFVFHGVLPSIVLARMEAHPGEKKLMDQLFRNSSWPLFLFYEALLFIGTVIILWLSGLPSFEGALMLGLALIVPVFLSACFKKLMTSES
mgnify:CR=1 FL=1